jgi:hypothetical protein
MEDIKEKRITSLFNGRPLRPAIFLYFSGINIIMRECKLTVSKSILFDMP